MKTVVITGSARGLGFEMAKLFKQNNLNVVISDLYEETLIKAKEELDKIPSVDCLISEEANNIFQNIASSQ